jgi:hypothetical protein
LDFGGDVAVARFRTHSRSALQVSFDSHGGLHAETQVPCMHTNPARHDGTHTSDDGGGCGGGGGGGRGGSSVGGGAGGGGSVGCAWAEPRSVIVVAITPSSKHTLKGVTGMRGCRIS